MVARSADLYRCRYFSAAMIAAANLGGCRLADL
jgi:hypothetical protein